jgi:hypothetical protein
VKFLAIPLISLALIACGGGTEPFASPSVAAIKATAPAPAKKATTVTGGNAVVIHMYQALYRMAPSNELLLDYAFQANNDASTFVKNLTDRFATTSHADLAKLVLDNLGVTATSVPAINAKGQSEYGLLLDAVKQLLAAYPTMRGQVILNMTNLLAGLETDATYGTAAATYNVQSTANFLYSSNPANSVTAAVKPPPAPTVNVSVSQAKAAVGSSATLTWSSTNATSCVGLDSMVAGAQATSGSLTITPTVGGQFTYTISCDGTGGTAKQSASLVVPHPVKLSSYLNRNNFPIFNPRIPGMYEIAGYTPDTNELGFYSLRAIAFADFFQDSTTTAIAFSSIYKGVFGPVNKNRMPDSTSKIVFVQRKSDGSWADVTSRLITNLPDRYIDCITPGFTEVSDFNGDGKPDAIVGCTGIDFPLADYATQQANSVSYQYILLSQPDGTYKVSRMDSVGKIYAHGVSVADIDGDGKADILFVDPLTVKTPFILWGNGDGSFRMDTSRFPTDMLDKMIFIVRAIDVGGKTNILVSGEMPNSALDNLSSAYGLKVLTYDGNRFQYDTDLTPIVPVVALDNAKKYQLALDVVYSKGFYYMVMVDASYSNSGIIRFDGVSRNTTILSSSTTIPAGPIMLTAAEKIVSVMAGCSVGESTDSTMVMFYECTLSVPIQ